MVQRTKTMLGEGHGANIDNGQTNYEIENELVDLLDTLPIFRKYEQMFHDLSKGNLDMPAAIKQVSTSAFIELLKSMHSSEDEKVRVDIAKDFLDRAGYGKTQKMAVLRGNINVDDSKVELINYIMSAAKRSGFEVMDGEKVEKAPKDVTPGKHTDPEKFLAEKKRNAVKAGKK